MEKLELQGTDETPTVHLDKAEEIFEISGRSLPQDAAAWYQQVLDWLDEYAKDPNPTTTFTFKLEYFNTASSKVILNLFYALDDIPGVKVNWYFHEEDEDMEEAGEEFSELVDIPFTFIALD